MSIPKTKNVILTHVKTSHDVQVFVGNLPPDAEARDIRDFFRDYGTLNDAWVARKPPGFGFAWFDSERDAVRCQ